MDMRMTLQAELLELFDRLTPLERRRVVAFARELADARRPASGAEIVRRMMGTNGTVVRRLPAEARPEEEEQPEEAVLEPVL